MRADGYPQEAWERLGRLLEERRGELNPDWANRAQFLRDTGMNKKLIERLELARLDTYRPATLAKVSVAYGWTADSIRRILSGGEPQPRAGTQDSEPELVPLDAFERAVVAADLSYDAKAAAIREHRETIRRQLADLGITRTPSFVRRAVTRGDDEPGQQDARPA